jgi:molecular chaperone GrpE
VSDDVPGGPGLPVPDAAPEATSETPGTPELVAPEPETTNPEADAHARRARLAEDRLAEVLAAYRALKQETEAYRERMSRGIERRFEERRDQLLVKFIEILDNFDRALDAAEKSGAHTSLIEGLILVRTQLVQTLKDQGLERIPVLGLPFDPEASEVVQMETVDDPDQDQVVIRELQRGYRLGGRVARASRVIVAQYRPPEPPEPEAVSEPIAAAENPPDGTPSE